MLQISAYCNIDSTGVVHNGKQLWANDSGLQSVEMLQRIYSDFSMQYPKFAKMDALCKLSFLTSEFVLKDLKKDYSEFDCSVILSNHSSSLNTDRLYTASRQQIPSPALFVCTLPNIAIAEICIRNKFKGENNFFITENFDANQLYTHVKNMFDLENTKFCLCGWVELMNETFRSTMFVVERKDNSDNTLPFTALELNNIFDKK